jgi:hypothetical protein
MQITFNSKCSLFFNNFFRKWSRISLKDDNDDLSDDDAAANDGADQIRDKDLRKLFNHVSKHAVFDRLHRRSPPPLLPFCGNSLSNNVFHEVKEREYGLKRESQTNPTSLSSTPFQHWL